MNPRWRVLDGLPPYGAMPEQFGATGQSMHREGFVVAFSPSEAPMWVGNFQRGSTSLDVVLVSRSDATVTVIAGGLAYVVDPGSRSCIRTFGDRIEQVFELGDLAVFSNGLWMEATDGERIVWRTRRLSWDGMRNAHVDGEKIVGDAYDPMEDIWTRFTVDLATGEVEGGSYPPDLPT